MRRTRDPRFRYLQLGLELLGIAVALYGISRWNLVAAIVIAGVVAMVAAQFLEELL